MAAKPQTPRFYYNKLQDKIYVVTKWRTLPNGQVLVMEKHELTNEFKKFARQMIIEGVL
jgi:hypothetical protein